MIPGGVDGVGVDLPVAVVVDLITDLHGQGVHGAGAVITLQAGREAVGVVVLKTYGAVAVVVVGVGAVGLRGAGEERRVRVIAVAVLGHEALGGLAGQHRGPGAVAVAVLIGVDRGGVGGVLVYLPVTVVVEAVALFLSAGVHRGVVVVAVLLIGVAVAVLVMLARQDARLGGGVFGVVTGEHTQGEERGEQSDRAQHEGHPGRGEPTGWPRITRL